ncbi:MAG: DUF5684 domain-containing protein [Bacillota bacterium]|nr:DUF5684 domain-containing protein [Bacillota bacterium]
METSTNVLAGLIVYFGAVFISLGIRFLFKIIGLWKMFSKANEKGWKALVPVYNEYILHSLVWDTKYFWIKIGATITITILEGLVSGMQTNVASSIILLMAFIFAIMVLVLNWKYAMNTAQAYGKGKWFGVGMFFVPAIFRIIIGLDSSSYQGKKRNCHF